MQVGGNAADEPTLTKAIRDAVDVAITMCENGEDASQCAVAWEVVEELSPEVRAAVLAEISDYDREMVETSLAFEDETAGRLMQREFVAAPDFWTVGHALDHMREPGNELPETFFDLFIVDAGFRPVGEIPVCRLLSAQRDVTLTELMETPRN